MVPTPTPAPPMPMQAIPAPMYFAAIGSMRKAPFRGVEDPALMAGVNRIVEIDASEDGEDVGLQEGHEQLERGQRDRQAERQHGAEPAQEAEAAEHHDEAAEHLERDVTGEHVGEQSYAVGDRPRQERQH